MGKDKKQLAIALAGLFLVILVAFTVLLLFRVIRWPGHTPTPPPPSISNPPIYPLAQDVKLVPNAIEFGQQITFETSDDPRKVMDYYNNLLKREGWEPVSVDQPEIWLAFKYGDGPYYQIGVQVRESSLGHTGVTLNLQTIPRIDQ